MHPERRLVAGSLGIAVPACLLPCVFYKFSENLFLACLFISLILEAVWLARLGAVLIRQRKQGLWFLTGTPFALFWPSVLFMIWWACKYRNTCL